MAKIPEDLPISPITLACPRCGAKPGQACQGIDGLEMIHLERIEAAAAMAKPSFLLRP